MTKPGRISNQPGSKTESASDVYVYRGASYVLQGKNSEAIKELEKAIKLDEKNSYAYYYQGLAYYQSGQAEKAVTALKMFLQLNPNAPEAGKAKKLVDRALLDGGLFPDSGFRILESEIFEVGATI